MKKIIAFFKDGKFEEILGCTAIALVILPVIVNIINRSFLNKYSLNLEAIALLAYVWIGYGFFGYMYKRDAHVDVKFIVNKMSPGVRTVFDVLRDVLILAFAVYMTYWGVKLTMSNTARYVAGTKIPLAYGYASIAFGYFSGALSSLRVLCHRVYGLFTKMVSGGMNMNLMAIPFFITAGLLMNYTGITTRMMKFADLLVGHMWGGLAQVNVLLSTLMGGLCGSSNADAAMQCKMLVPEMEERGFNRAFSAGVTAASALISPMIPPGVMLILYASITENSVLDMFMAGYLPGILMCIVLMVAVNYVSHRDGYKPTREKRASFKEVMVGLVECFWAVVMIVVLIVGLRSGIVTATEGGAVLCVLCVIVGAFIYKQLHWKDLLIVAKEAFASVTNVFGIIVSATVFGLYLTYAQIPQRITALFMNITSSPIVFLLLVNLMLLIMGMLVDGAAVLMIAVPLLYPVAMQLGINPIHFGIIFILNLSIGGLTPPFGATMYQCCNLCGIEIPEFLKQSKELILALLVALLFVTFIPGISTLLPTLMK